MTLTKFSDYSLRLLIYLGLHTDRLVSVGEVSRAYRVSPHILVKVVQLLVGQGLVTSVRGHNGGLRLAWMALLANAASKHESLDTKTATGYTPKQEIFLGWAQNWCSTERPEMQRMLVRIDVHSPDHIRANGVIVNMPEFRQAFGCKIGQPMAPAPEKMCRVW